MRAPPPRGRRPRRRAPPGSEPHPMARGRPSGAVRALAWRRCAYRLPRRLRSSPERARVPRRAERVCSARVRRPRRRGAFPNDVRRSVRALALPESRVLGAAAATFGGAAARRLFVLRASTDPGRRRTPAESSRRAFRSGKLVRPRVAAAGRGMPSCGTGPCGAPGARSGSTAPSSSGSLVEWKLPTREGLPPPVPAPPTPLVTPVTDDATTCRRERDLGAPASGAGVRRPHLTLPLRGRQAGCRPRARDACSVGGAASRARLRRSSPYGPGSWRRAGPAQ